MESFNLTVMNFFRTLEACSAEQRSLSTEVLESLNSYVEEILVASYDRIDSPGTLNVPQLLFQDLADLSRHLLPEQHDKVIIYLTTLQEAKEDRLSSLHRTIAMCREKFQEAEKAMLQKKAKEQEKTDLIDFLTMATNIIQGIITSNLNDSHLKGLVERMKEHRGTFNIHDDVMDVDEINGRSLGKMIVRYCGLEATEGKPGLRGLLQGCIAFLRTQAGGFWKNASITIYDEDDNMCKIVSGTRKHQFICRMKNGEPFIKEKKAVNEYKKPHHKPLPESTFDPSQKTEIFGQTVRSFCRALEACNEEQRFVANEVLKSFCTFVEEILLTFYITVGPSDTTNVCQLLFQDLVDLSGHLQPEQKEMVISYLTRLQGAKKDRLIGLHRTITMCRDNLEVAEKEVLRKKMKEEEKEDFMNFLTMTTNIIQGIITSNPNDSNLKILIERMQQHQGTFSYQDELMDVEEINKRTLGKMIVRYIGHEGVEEKPNLRRLFQACIDFLQTETGEYWKNASITIYDEDDNMYKIVSGTRKHQFICRMKNGEPFIKEKKSVKEYKKPKPYQNAESACDRHGHTCSIS